MQRLPDRHIALIGHVEILRPIPEKIRRPVLDHGFLGNQPLLEGKAVDERLQRRTRRPEHACHVDPAGTPGIEIIRRTHLTDDLAGRRIRHHHGKRNFWGELGGGFARHLLQLSLDAAFQRSAIFFSLRLLADGGFGKMRGIGRQLQPLPWNCIQGSSLRLALSRHGRHRGTGQNAFARGMRHLRMAIRPAHLRRLRQGNQQCRLRHRQSFRLLAEPGKARGPNPFQIAAIGRVGEIEF